MSVATVTPLEHDGKLHIEAHTYRCPLCGGWHLTHLEPGKR